MTMPSSSWLRLACALWVGVMAGFFFAFSFVVMPGLAAMEPLAALASMQAINLAVRNAVFAIGFFSALVLSVAVALHALVRRDAPAGRLALAAALIYLIGAFGVTSAFNVPLNGDIAPLDPARSENAQAMISYIAEWTLWNHVRTLASLASFVLLLLSLRAGWGEPGRKCSPQGRLASRPYTSLTSPTQTSSPPGTPPPVSGPSRRGRRR